MSDLVFLKDVFPDYNGIGREDENQDKIEKYKKEFLELKQKQYKQIQESRNNMNITNQLHQNPIRYSQQINNYQHPSSYIEHFTTPQIPQIPQTQQSPIQMTCEIFLQHMKNCKRCEYIYNNNSFYNNLIEIITYILTGILFIFILDVLVKKK